MLGHVTNLVRIDAQSGASRVIRTADWRGTNQFPLPLLFWETDETGRQMTYTYDALKRVKTSTLKGTAGQPDLKVTFTYNACDRLLGVRTNAGSLSLSNTMTYDLSGRLTFVLDSATMVTTYTYINGGNITQVTYPGGASLYQTKYLSGELKSETGTATVNKYYDHNYNAVSETLPVTIQKHTNALARTTCFGSAGSPRQETTYYNLWDSPIWVVRPGLTGQWLTNAYFYANIDENVTSTEALGTDFSQPIQEYFSFDTENHGAARWQFVSPDGSSNHLSMNLAPAVGSRDRLAQTVAGYTNLSGVWYRFTNTFVYLGDYSAAPTLLGQTRVQLSGQIGRAHV